MNIRRNEWFWRTSGIAIGVVLSCFVSGLKAQSVPEEKPIVLPVPGPSFETPIVRSPVIDVAEIEFDGNRLFSADQIRLGIQTCPEVVALLHPKSLPDDQVQAIAKAIQAGYSSSGVTAAVHPHVVSTLEKLSVRYSIEEGPRTTWSGLEIQCKNESLRKAIERSLTGPKIPHDHARVPAFDGTQWVGRKPGTTLSEWLDPSNAIGSEKAVITVGAPACAQSQAFQKSCKQAISVAIESAGFVDAQITLDFQVDHERHNILCVVGVPSVGRSLEMHEIRFEGLTRHTSQQLQEYLNLHEGDSFSLEALLTAQRRLYESGRFQWHTVDWKSLPGAESGSSKRNVTIRVAECDTIPKLDEPLNENHQTLLKIGNALNHLFDDDQELMVEYSGKLPFINSETWFKHLKERKIATLRLFVGRNSFGLETKETGSERFFASIHNHSFEYIGSGRNTRYQLDDDKLKFSFVGSMRGIVPKDSKTDSDADKKSNLSFGGKASSANSKEPRENQFTASPFSMLCEEPRMETHREQNLSVIKLGDSIEVRWNEMDGKIAEIVWEDSSFGMIRVQVAKGLLASHRQAFEREFGFDDKSMVVDLVKNSDRCLDISNSACSAFDGLISQSKLAQGLLADLCKTVPYIRSMADHFTEKDGIPFHCSTDMNPRHLGISLGHCLAIKLFSPRSPHAMFFRKVLLAELSQDPEYIREAQAFAGSGELNRPSLAILASMVRLSSQPTSVSPNLLSAAMQFAMSAVNRPKDFLTMELPGYDRFDTPITRNISQLLLNVADSPSLTEVRLLLEPNESLSPLFTFMDVIREDTVHTLLEKSANPAKLGQANSRSAEKETGTISR